MKSCKRVSKDKYKTMVAQKVCIISIALSQGMLQCSPEESEHHIIISSSVSHKSKVKTSVVKLENVCNLGT
jgi:hypothetical protein